VWTLSVLLCATLLVLFVVLLAVLRYPVPVNMVRHWRGISERPRYTITYYDRNHDGEIDLEIHQADATDSDWGLTDSDFKGFYNELWVNGVAGHSYPVQVPIPGGVPIAKEVPEKYRSPHLR
jgi:hypothetical protein